MSFLPPTILPCPVEPVAGAQDQVGGCSGYAETVVEVAGDGTIWASTTCCIGRPPPIWTSRDQGASFELLRDPVREAIGVEGDFAIDASGNVYFLDMLGAYPGIVLTSYTALGEHRWTIPFPARFADRPWIRAGATDQVFAAYSTLDSTVVLSSADGGQTWDALGLFEVPCRLGVLGQGPEPGHVYLVACTRQPRLWETTDGAASWTAPVDVPIPIDGLATFRNNDHDYFSMAPVVDDAGTVYVPFKHPLGGTPPPEPLLPTTVVGAAGEEEGIGIFLSRRAPDGAWLPPVRIGPNGTNTLPWAAAGAAGVLGLAWYHTDDATPTEASRWFLMSAASSDADAQDPAFQVVVADPEPVATGTPGMIFGSPPAGHTLGDFLQADLAPDGRLVIGYARLGAEATTGLVVRSDGKLALDPGTFRNGP